MDDIGAPVRIKDGSSRLVAGGEELTDSVSDINIDLSVPFIVTCYCAYTGQHCCSTGELNCQFVFQSMYQTTNTGGLIEYFLAYIPQTCEF